MKYTRHCFFTLCHYFFFLTFFQPILFLSLLPTKKKKPKQKHMERLDSSMAESFLFDIAGEIIRKLGSRAVRKVALWWGVKAEIDKLKDIVDTIKAVLLDAEEKQEHNNQVKLWLAKLKCAMYDAEDLLGDFSTEALQRQALDGSRLTKEVRLFFSRSNQFAYGLKMGQKVKSLRERLAGINDGRSSFQLEERLPDQYEATNRTRRDRKIDAVALNDVVYGRERDKNAIMKLLSDAENFGVSVPVISIVGTGGLGKTTLAQLVLNDYYVQLRFELRVWVTVSDDFDTETIIRKILESANKKKPVKAERNTHIATLNEITGGMTFLLILDDVWEENAERWNELKRLLRDGCSGSRVLVTTRSMKVGSIASEASPIYDLPGLPVEESWSLLEAAAFSDREVPRNPRLEEIGREIIGLCGGVPLVIKTIGRALHFKETEEEWLSFKHKALSSADYVVRTGSLFPLLKLCYDHLSSKLKRCFAYCSIFPKDYRIDVETLIQLWIAQGFVTGSSLAGERLEDVGLACFEELLWRCFFQEVECDEWGNKSCKMHDYMHELATFVGIGESYILREDGGVDNEGNFRHVSFGFDWISSEQIPTEFIIRAKCLRTILLPCQHRSGSRVESKVCEAILHYFRGLRALDLHSLALEKLPASVVKLKHLTYLDLSDNGDMRTLPNSISRLQNLQVLKLRGCSLLSELPKEISKLINLGCLDCRGCDALRHMPHDLGQLTSLWRLTVFVVGKGSGSSGASEQKYDSGGLEELHGLNNLRGSLEIKNLSNVRNRESEFEAANLNGKNLLQSLHLDWGRDDGCNWAEVDIDYEEMSLQRLRPHPNLEGLRVDGYGGVRFPSWFSSLTNLVKIKIHNCRKCQCVPLFHQFPSLQELEIWFVSELEYLVEDKDGEINNAESSSSTLFFPSLKSLSLVGCPKLKGWWKNRGGTSAATVPLELPYFDRLSRLMILWCPNLTQMPLFPSVTDELKLEGSSVEPLRQTMEMERKSTMATSLSSPSPGALVMHPILCELKELSLRDIRDLESLPEEWLQNLTFLQQLELWNCPNLESLPQGMNRLTSLRKLSIWACPQLEERCRNKSGADWAKISHIPNIEIDQKDIQKDGRYLLDDEQDTASSASEPQRTAVKSVLEHICNQVNWMVDQM